MRGILQGLGLTLSHLTRPKVTRLYPYEKRVLPERSRGLIQLIQENGQDTPFNLKCEACLLCEKICPPRAITIESRPTLRFRRRPYFSEGAVAGFYTPRISEYAINYDHPPLSPPTETPISVDLEEPVDLMLGGGDPRPLVAGRLGSRRPCSTSSCRPTKGCHWRLHRRS